MNKPKGYDDIQTGGFTPVIPGPHLAIIKTAEEMRSAAGNPMVKIEIEFQTGDSQPGYFGKLFAADTRFEKKWPAAGVAYINSEDREGNATKQIKQFVTSFERSNNTEIQWGKDFCKCLIGKQIGVNFGEVEDEYNGKRVWKRKIRWYFDVNKIEEQTIPEKQPLKDTVSSAPVQTDFMSTDDSPFV